MDKKTEFRQQKKKADRQILFLLVIGIGLVLAAGASLFFLPKAQAETELAGVSAVPVPASFPAPQVQLTDLNNTPVSLADYRGQVVLYNAWATWCPPCKEEMPTLQAYYDAHKSEGFVVIAIEDGEPVQEVADFVKEYGLTFPVWPDEKWVATTAFKTENLPTSFLIDRDGQVKLTWTGAISMNMLEKYVTPIIRQ